MNHPWNVSKGKDRYRRGLYTFVFRNSVHPLLGSFDIADATSTCTRRNRSNTPLQALSLLNDEAFVEFAQSLAERTLKEAPADDASRIDYAFRLCTARKPAADERRLWRCWRNRRRCSRRRLRMRRRCAASSPEWIAPARLAG